MMSIYRLHWSISSKSSPKKRRKNLHHKWVCKFKKSHDLFQAQPSKTTWTASEMRNSSLKSFQQNIRRSKMVNRRKGQQPIIQILELGIRNRSNIVKSMDRSQIPRVVSKMTRYPFGSGTLTESMQCSIRMAFRNLWTARTLTSSV